ncbi:MAG TPA: PilN domain-containing protein [Phycisphaeraceae bacterium]
MTSHEVNFLPQSYRLRRERFRRRCRQGALAAVMAASLMGWWMIQRGQTAAWRGYAQTLEAEVEAARLQAQGMAKLHDQRRMLIRQLNLQQELAQPVRHTQILLALSQVVPESIVLTWLDMTTQRPAPEPLMPAGAKASSSAGKSNRASGDAPVEDLIRIELAGLAPDDLTVANLLEALKLHPLFTNAKIHFSRNTDIGGVSARQFQIELTVPLGRRFQIAPPVEEEVARAG